MAAFTSKVRDNRSITKRSEYVDLLHIAKSLEKTIAEGKYSRGERAKLENALMDIELVKELMG